MRALLGTAAHFRNLQYLFLRHGHARQLVGAQELATCQFEKISQQVFHNTRADSTTHVKKLPQHTTQRAIIFNENEL